MIKILLLFDYSSEFDRKLLTGLVRYSKENVSWVFYRLPQFYAEQNGGEGVIKWAKEWGADAIVGKLNKTSVESLKSLNIPIVVQNYKHRSTDFPNITGDYIGTGKMAAKFFLERKYENFAFFGLKNIVWSEERCQGFESVLNKEAKKVYIKTITRKNSSKTREQVLSWLFNLPKPVALFCCDDESALFISEIAKLADISVPDDIAILGVDNDELTCNISDPPLSSIALEVETGGYLLGSMLHQQISTGEKKHFNIVINPTRIVKRESTEKHNLSDKRILKVVKYIDDYHYEDITVEQLMEMTPFSRRNFEQKFKEQVGVTIYQYLLHTRVNHLADLLLTTNKPLMELATEAGFADYNNIARVFKKFKGCTPAEYRKKRSFVK